jgi:exodeoxyribonuclease V beta subunit
MNPRRAARPAVLRSIPLDRNAVIEASAGTGKTFTLEHLVVELLLKTDATIDRLLVVTFTEKATNELRARVRAKLVELLSSSPPHEAATEKGDFWSIDDDARERLARAVHAFDGATITTIHAFCQRVLREQAFDSGRMFEEKQVDGRDAFGRAIREALRRGIARDRERAQWLEVALRIGWSIGRIEELLWECVQSRGEPRPLLDAATLNQHLDAFPIEDARRADGVAEMCDWGMHPATAKTVARRLYELADVVERSGVARSLPAYVLSSQDVGFAYLLQKLPSFLPRPGRVARLCDAALELAGSTPTFAAGLAQMILPPVRDEFTRRKREAGQYDFDDMLTLVDEALSGSRGDTLATAMRDRWRYVLIDEFQDTDETQWSIFRQAFFDRAGRSSVLYLVGDPKQSIYRFRGADVHTYLRAREEIVAAGGRPVPLDQNHRATRSLVDATNLIFDQAAPNRIFSGSIEYRPVTCGRPDRTLVDGSGRATSPVHVMRFCAAPDAEAVAALGHWMAREIEAITDPSRPWRLDGRALEYGDVFVLTRNAREGRTTGAALRAAGVPHAFYKQDGLFQTNEATEVRTLLLAIDEPHDRARRLSAWLTPFFGLSLADIERARDLPGSHPIVARLHEWKALADARDFDRLFERLLQGSGVVRREIFFADGERELTNYLHVLELLREHAHRSHATLRDLVHALSGLIDGTRLPLDLEGNVQRLESERRAVQIMTIHKSKGLQAPIVFVVGGFSQPRGDEVRIYHEGGKRLAWVGAASDPEVEAHSKAEEREEEQRLMYVALTRAEGRLYLPCAVRDAVPGQAGGDEPRALRGPYDIVNRRIAELLRADQPSLSVQDVVPVGEATGVIESGRRGHGWHPAAALLNEENDSVSYAELRQRHAGAFVTSYTRMKGERAAARRTQGEGIAEAIDEAPGIELRGARSSGVFLHELLERMPIASFAESAGLEPWRLRAEVSLLFDEAMATHRIDRGQRAHAEQLVWWAYTTRLALPRGGWLEGIAASPRVAREMGFVFSIPESARKAGPARTVCGYVRGSIDLAFEHEGHTYFVDWKSDSLSSYSPEALGRHIHLRYEAQAQLYCVAIGKLLGAKTRAEYDARFGGMFYCFLRGFGARGCGLWSVRPSWDEVLSWENALLGALGGAGGAEP